MSGGSYDYAFRHIDDLAYSIRENAGCRPGEGDSVDDYGSPPSLRRAFAEHLRKVARAAKAIEWNDSGDGDRDEQRLIRACIAPDDELKAATLHAREALAELNAVLTLEGGGQVKPRGMNGHLLAFMVKPPPLKFRVEKLTANGWRRMGWAGSTEEAEDLAAHGLGGVCRITECDGREYRRAVRLEAIETGRRAS